MAVADEACRLTEKMRHAFSGLEHRLRADVDEVMNALAQTFEDYQRKAVPNSH